MASIWNPTVHGIVINNMTIEERACMASMVDQHRYDILDAVYDDSKVVQVIKILIYIFF